MRLRTFFTVRLPVLHVKHAVSDGLLTGDADEAGHVPGLFQGIHDVLRGGQIKTGKSSGYLNVQPRGSSTFWGSDPHPLTHPQNLVLAAGTGGGEVLPVAMLTVQLALLLHEPIFHQGGVAVGTGEFLRVPRQTHGHEEGASGGRGWRKELPLHFFSLSLGTSWMGLRQAQKFYRVVVTFDFI